MKNIDELYNLMPDLLTRVLIDGEQFTFDDKAKAIIKEIADFARTTKFYRENKDKMYDFWAKPEDRTPTKVWLCLLNKITEAPTSLHRNFSVIGHMPILDDILNSSEEERSEVEENDEL